MRGTDRGKGWAFLSGSRGEAKWIVLLFFVVLFFHGSYRIFNLNLRISSGCRFFLVSLSDEGIFWQNVEVSCQENILKNQDTIYTHANTAGFSGFAHLRITGLNISNWLGIFLPQLVAYFSLQHKVHHNRADTRRLSIKKRTGLGSGMEEDVANFALKNVLLSVVTMED